MRLPRRLRGTPHASERRCTTAALRDGAASSAVDEARQRVEEIEAALKDEGQGPRSLRARIWRWRSGRSRKEC